MKKIITFFLLLIISFQIISAVEININSNVSKGETIIASVSGDFLEQITAENIHFYRGHVATSFEYGVAKIGEEHYIYIKTVGKSENNYSINISGVRYWEGSQISEEQISKSFKIINETADFSVSPGLFITSEDFYIKLQNLQSSELTIVLETEVNSGGSDGEFKFVFDGNEVEQEITLSPGEIRNLYIELENISETTIRTIILSTNNTEYNIPCYIIGENAPDSDEEENTSTNEEEQIPEETDLTEKNCSFFDVLFGKCDTSTTQNKTYKNETESKKNNSDVDYEVVKQGNKTVAIKDGKVLNGTATMKTCEQINGDVCSLGEICKNETINAKDAQCCISECVKKEQNKNTKILGWTIIVLIIVMILWFFLKKFRGTKIKKDSLLGSRK
jgi:hypothetical protein